MAHQASYPDSDDLSHYHYQAKSSYFQEPQSEVKASYDDLIDEYASPYAANTHHKTFAVETPMTGAPQHRRGPSTPMKTTFSSKQSDDTFHDQPLPLYPPPPVKDMEKQRWYQWANIIPDSIACRLYILTVLIETAIDLAIEGELLVRVNRETEDGTNTKKMSVYLSIFAIAHVFQFYMAAEAVVTRNTLQFIALTLFNALLLLYAVIQIGEIKQNVDGASGGISDIPIDVLTVIIPCVIAAAELAFMGLGWKIYHEFGWKVYKFLGADRRIKKLYANYQIYECLIKFDVFFFAGFSVQFLWLVLNSNDWEYYVTIAALPLSIVLLVEGHYAAKYENKWMMATFMSGCVGAMVYFVYKFVKVLMYKDREAELQSAWKSLTIFSVIAILLLSVTFVFSYLITRGFGRGLKDSLKRKNSMSGKNPSHSRAASANPNRMSID
ncbi:uncharacterized protein EV420DRAFT_1513867 [Desarmillaria tabescens]|uniref:Uncharacterized protein n=1 Tax=Armillaria tabescens TaxID=1929756 RepID=A0AA39NGQ0_ARMTA|nr:uncharacterized protein EV420DRAFT_1513867 [Desarmillaria tabescens]KAK0465316.1 hypothetical protein EV420DRAFT_1513867 [Desarmillaria tabescens]